jgi:hypothetical protein
MGNDSAWPESYRPLDVDLAWQAWQAATALQAERIGELEADAARYQWLKRNVGEALTENSMKNEFSEHKMRYVFPTLISWADFCGPITLDEAIDFKIEQALSATAREEQSCKS